MFKVTKSGDTTEIVSGTRLIPVASAFFLLLGVLDVAAAFVSAHPGDLLGPGIACVVVGGIWGFFPYRVVLSVDRGLGELRRTARGLFSRSEITEKLGELESVTVNVLTYSWSYGVTRKNGSFLPLLAGMKTWTFTRAPTPDVTARAQELATALGLPYVPPKS